MIIYQVTTQFEQISDLNPSKIPTYTLQNEIHIFTSKKGAFEFAKNHFSDYTATIEKIEFSKPDQKQKRKTTTLLATFYQGQKQKIWAANP